MIQLCELHHGNKDLLHYLVENCSRHSCVELLVEVALDFNGRKIAHGEEEKTADFVNKFFTEVGPKLAKEHREDWYWAEIAQFG